MESSKTDQIPDQPKLSFTVQGYDKRGYGLAPYTRSDGFSYTARIFNSIDGEELESQNIVRSREGKGLRDVIDPEITKTSIHRVEPKCRHFGSCGGCVFQHISIDHQKQIKEQKIHDLFQPIASPFIRLPLIGVSQENGMVPWEYRNKMEFSFAADRKGKRFLGLYDRLGRGVVSLQECHLVSSWVSRGINAILAWWESRAPHLEAFNARTGNGALRTVTFREGLTTGDRMIILTVSSKPEFAPSKADLNSFQKRMEEEFLSETQSKNGALSVVLRIHQAIPKKVTQIYEMMLTGPDYIRETITAQLDSDEKCEYTFHISPQAFFQPNSGASGVIYSEALKLAKISEHDTVYDLYCGTGTFGMFAAKYAKKVIAIELSKDAAYDAKTNAERLGLGNFYIHCGDVGAVLESVREGVEQEAPIIIVDPPRTGLLPAAIEQIIQLSPKRIIYVSCNPERQVADIQEFQKSGLYSLIAIRPIDQFPHTPHIENIALLERVSSQ
ncbi:MAG: 23S rRNA (uracil(1939)-C(5))-methyltransferase RlmD [Chlamydia sp.]